MANLPPSFASSKASSSSNDPKPSPVEQLVLDICDPELRENALHQLSKKREIFHELAPLLWHSVGTTAALLQEIISVYPFLSPPTLTVAQSNRVCNALALCQCVAAHPETKMPFLRGITILDNLTRFSWLTACLALRDYLPDLLSDTTFTSCLYEEPAAVQWLQQMHHNIRVRPPPGL
ncbi:hypothetical protein F2Q69_00044968 [Brassica cretica]|uniref:CCR4-NOT transcription complex subunit 9 n=1 Tax=Brassica cretica TaxID=69181 RepID=A0A8S9ND26_BRACR|nr:hypothetical protein F2Q69_00044968 [Brassica cretica]